VVQDFSNLYQLLSESIHPEITHYQKSNHPGIGWYLKTIIPTIDVASFDSLEIYNYMVEISNHYPSLLCITPQAYNWKQETIPNWHTVWIRDGMDLHITIDSMGCITHEIDEYQVGVKHHTHVLWQEISNLNLDNFSEQQKEHLEKIADVIQFLHTYTDEATSKLARKNFRVIK